MKSTQYAALTTVALSLSCLSVSSCHQNSYQDSVIVVDWDQHRSNQPEEMGHKSDPLPTPSHTESSRPVSKTIAPQIKSDSTAATNLVEPVSPVGSAPIPPVPTTPNPLVASPSVTPVVDANEIEKKNQEVLLAEKWIQTQYKLEDLGLNTEDLVDMDPENAILRKGVDGLPPAIWIPRLDNVVKKLSEIQLNTSYVVKRYEKILTKLLGSRLSPGDTVQYQDKLSALMKDLDKKSLFEVNKQLTQTRDELIKATRP